MKKFLTSAAATTLFALPLLASAQLASGSADGGQFEDFLLAVLQFTNSVLIPFIIGIGFLVFVFGMFWYFIAGGADEEKRAKGRSLMIYSVLAFVLIVVFWGVVNLVADSLFDSGDIDALDNVPTIPTTPRPNT